MKQLSRFMLVKIVTKLLILVLIAKSLSVVILFVLPTRGVELNKTKNLQPKYQKVNFNNIGNKSKVILNKSKNKISNIETNIKNMILKGLYGKGNYGFIILAIKSNPSKTTILSIGEKYKGYTLENIKQFSAIFNKNSKKYILKMDTSNLVDLKRIKTIKEKVLFGVTQKNVSRKDISYYAENPKKIWKDISIIEVKKNNQIKGFKITFIKKSSPIEQLGLKKDDLIIRANNIELKSYKDALDIYKDIDELNNIEIVVLRNNQEMEFTYEIN